MCGRLPDASAGAGDGVAAGTLAASGRVISMSWLVTRGYSASTRALSLSMMRVFFDACHRHGWLPGLAANAVIYVEELPLHHEQLARFIPRIRHEPARVRLRLARLPNPTTRNLMIVLIETGLRVGDACNLEFNPMIDDSVGWPCLRFDNTKVSAEQLIPLSAKAAAAIRAQQDHDRRQWPAAPRGCSPGSSTTRTGPSPTPTAPSAVSSSPGRTASTCATRPANPSG